MGSYCTAASLLKHRVQIFFGGLAGGGGMEDLGALAYTGEGVVGCRKQTGDPPITGQQSPVWPTQAEPTTTTNNLYCLQTRYSLTDHLL